MRQFIDIINQMLKRFTPVQRILIVIVFIGMLSAIISLVMWANRPEYTVLYSDLEPSSASKIVSDLRSMKIKYKLEHNGRMISVPGKDVAELRLKFSEAGYVENTTAGYEVFDNAKIGMTSFMQQLNMRRALEGELVKTINQFPGIRNSRVHLVLPEGKLFEEDRKGSASVVLYLKKGMYLSSEQVRGIAALVSNGVKGIDPENVVVVDTEGNLLSESNSEETAVGTARNQWDLRKSIESKLQKKILRIVEGIVGNNNAVVEVSAELDFEQTERTIEAYDPDNVVVVSEERHSETSSGSDPTQSTSEDVITNFELNKTVEHFISSAGTINMLSIAVLVNGKVTTTTDNSGKDVSEYTPRSNDELAQIATLVKSAAGYSENRGDIVEVRNLQFDRSAIETDNEYFVKAEKREMMMGMITKLIIGIGVLMAFFLTKKLLESAGKTVRQVQSGGSIAAIQGISRIGLPEPGANDEIAEDMYMKNLSPEAQARLKAKDRMTEAVVSHAKEKPEDAAKLLRSWLTGDQ
ncbi:MAG: flagellar basal-body MS-ring/collar protein FliF [Candidatus Hatepunaea meridiana]|nr:flagellar basal-body MS-ring/collar protein FliF [Candidatus Hatepunaea meridiana]